MMLGMQPGQIIREAREKKGLSQKGLGDLVGITQPAVKKIEDGETSKTKFLPKIAQVLELDLAVLDASLNSQIIDEPPPLQVTGRPTFRIFASAEGGPGEIIRSAEPVDFVPRPTHLLHVQDAYGLLITGSSMEPEYNAGEMAIVEPSMPLISNEVYIFYAERHGEARATIKKLRRATAENWLVTQHNPPEGKAKDFSLPRREWAIAHRVTGKFTRR